MKTLQRLGNALYPVEFGPAEDRFGPPPYRIGPHRDGFQADSGQICTAYVSSGRSRVGR
jgi:hypothetical protein